MLFGVAVVFFFQAEDGIRDLVRSRGLGDVYKRQPVAVAQVRQVGPGRLGGVSPKAGAVRRRGAVDDLSLIHI